VKSGSGLRLATWNAVDIFPFGHFAVRREDGKIGGPAQGLIQECHAHK
jgi:hypothetical protein